MVKWKLFCKSLTETKSSVVILVNIALLFLKCRLPVQAPLETDGQPLVDDDNWPSRGEIVFKNFSTRYREGLDLVVEKINIHIKGGEKVSCVFSWFRNTFKSNEEIPIKNCAFILTYRVMMHFSLGVSLKLSTEIEPKTETRVVYDYCSYRSASSEEQEPESRRWRSLFSASLNPRVETFSLTVKTYPNSDCTPYVQSWRLFRRYEFDERSLYVYF